MDQLFPNIFFEENLFLAIPRLVGSFLLQMWWLWSVLILGAIFLAVLQRWRRNIYFMNNPVTILEVRISREITKGPKAMEHVFANIHGLANIPGTFYDKYWAGEMTHWFGFEIASFGGDIRFYLYTPKKHQHIIEAHLYAHYPNLEIREMSEDYTTIMPSNLQDIYDSGYDLYGTEIVLGKENVYPIRTYTEFESMDEAQNLDPIAALIENLAKVRPDEHLWVQLLVRPVDFDWAEEGRKKIEEMRKKTETRTAEGETKQRRLTPAEEDAIKAIARDVGKPAFESLIRYVYFAPRNEFNHNFAAHAIFSSLNQYKSEALNYFKKNGAAATFAHWRSFPFFFVEQRKNKKKASLLFKYRERYMPTSKKQRNAIASALFDFDSSSKTMVLNTEELATIYHYPIAEVLTAPFMQRVESRRIGPPSGLPIFSGEESRFSFGDESADEEEPDKRRRDEKEEDIPFSFGDDSEEEE